jgi:hypothetical protein
VAVISPPISWKKPMLRKRRLDLIALCASILCAGSLFAVPAAANIRYVFTSDRGSFVYDSLSFFEGGSLSASELTRYSGDFEDVYFGSSDIVLVNAACRIADDCFDATFGLSGIFQTLGTYYASDGGAEIAISQVSAGEPVPELSSWALLAVGFAGLAFARNRRIWGPARPRLSEPLPMRRFKAYPRA